MSRNKEFEQYAANTAFRIELSANMIRFLLLAEASANGSDVNGWSYVDSLNTLYSIQRRGLITKNGVLTDAGELVVELLKLAGHKL